MSEINPKNINYIWFGGAIPFKYKQNIRRCSLLNGDEFKIRIWFDSNYLVRPRELNDNLTAEKIRDFRLHDMEEFAKDLGAELCDIRDEKISVKIENYDCIQDCLSKCFYVIAADLLRVEEPLRGVYLDTDVYVYRKFIEDSGKPVDLGELGTLFGFESNARQGVRKITSSAIFSDIGNRISNKIFEDFRKSFKENYQTNQQDIFLGADLIDEFIVAIAGPSAIEDYLGRDTDKAALMDTGEVKLDRFVDTVNHDMSYFHFVEDVVPQGFKYVSAQSESLAAEKINSVFNGFGIRRNILLSTTLLSAIKDKDSDKIRHILTNKVVNTRFIKDYSVSLLHTAADVGDVEILNMFLDEGCDINVLDDKGRAAIHIAAMNGQLESVRTLLERGCVANIQDRFSLDPADYAYDIGREDILFLLDEAQSPTKQVSADECSHMGKQNSEELEL